MVPTKRNKRFIDWFLRSKQKKTSLIISLKKGFFRSFSGQNKVSSSI